MKGSVFAQEFSLFLEDPQISSSPFAPQLFARGLALVDDDLQQKYRWPSTATIPLHLPVLVLFTPLAALRVPGIVATSFFHNVLVPRQWDLESGRVKDLPHAILDDTLQSSDQSWKRWVSLTRVPGERGRDRPVDTTVNHITTFFRFTSPVEQGRPSDPQQRADMRQLLIRQAKKTFAFVAPLLDMLLLQAVDSLEPHCGVLNDVSPGNVSETIPCFMGSPWVEHVVKKKLVGGSTEDSLSHRGVQLKVTDEIHKVYCFLID
jgi:hypothetical protein